ncbi:MAG: hypothetical protein AAF458_09800 [Pseudomonadota bacterium]
MSVAKNALTNSHGGRRHGRAAAFVLVSALCLPEALYAQTAAGENAGAGSQSGAAVAAVPNEQELQRNLETLKNYYDVIQQQLRDQIRDHTGAAAKSAGAKDPGTARNPGPGYQDGERDPFAPTSRLIDANTNRQGVDFQPGRSSAEALALPRMRLRGLVTENSGAIAALLEIENAGIHIVREGDTVGLYEARSSSVIRVRQINRLNVIVEVGTLGQTLIVR